MRISDWSSDVCSSDLCADRGGDETLVEADALVADAVHVRRLQDLVAVDAQRILRLVVRHDEDDVGRALARLGRRPAGAGLRLRMDAADAQRSEEHTSELQSLMRISYAVFCLKKKTTPINTSSTLSYH